MKTQLLLCESNPGCLARTREFLTRRGFDVCVASNGLECMELLREVRPDVVVLDWEMPWGGGDGVLALLQDELRLPPVIVSASDFGAVARKLRYDGIVELVSRPPAPKEIYSGILNALRRSENVCHSTSERCLVGVA